MSKTIQYLSFIAILFFSASCVEEQIHHLKGSLTVEPQLTDNPGSAVFSADKKLQIGEVPLYAKSLARFKLVNPSNKRVNISQVLLRNSRGSGVFAIVDFPSEVFPAQNNPPDSYLTVSYQPFSAWADANGNNLPDDNEIDRASFIIYSDAEMNSELEVTYLGYGRDFGQPVVQVCYDNYCGPTAADCNAGKCTLKTSLDFGDVNIGGTANKQLIINNNATCAYPEQWDICQHQDLCQLVIDKDRDNYNQGLFIMPQEGVHSERFSLTDGFDLPLVIAEDGVSSLKCKINNSKEMHLNYVASDSERSSDSAQLLLETNDPLARTILIPLAARTSEIPVAKCQALSDLQPYTQIKLDGTASYNQISSQETGAVSRYSWEVISLPDDVTMEDLALKGTASSQLEFYAPLPGEYKIALTVWNDAGISSNLTEESVCTLNILPGSKMHIQNTWDDPENDQDLHLVYLDNGKVCSKAADCFWNNEKPVWFPAFAAGEGPNPRLDIDDKAGFGPENINIDEPLPGRYRVYIHYYKHPAQSDTVAKPTTNILRIYLNGKLAGLYRQQLSQPKEMWAAVDIVWDGDNSKVEPLTAYGSASDATGWTCTINECLDADTVSCEAP